MKISFINHSCFIVEYDSKRVICDPWLEGRVFNNGWKLYAESKFSYDDFENIDYIWFSHEHPDHFYPPNISKIPAKWKERITILYQFTTDKRVKDYCLKAGFKDVIELRNDEYFKITESFCVLCEHFEEGDSWIHFKTPDLSVLNTNDCGITNVSDAAKISKKIGDVDILMTQFSYAYWAGNPEDVEYRKAVAGRKLDWLKLQCDNFLPKVIIPIASCVYFCHEENRYLNDSVNTMSRTYDFVLAKIQSKPVVLFNGETYVYPEEHDSLKSVAEHAQSLSSVLSDDGSFMKRNKIDTEDLISEANSFLEDLNSTNSFIVKWFMRPTFIRLFDSGEVYSLSLEGFVKCDDQFKPADVELAAESLLACFKFPYGLDSVQISGRLRKPIEGSYKNFYNIFRVNHLKMRGVNPNSMYYLINMVFRKLLFKLGIRNH